MFDKSPDALCLQLMRFSNKGHKIKSLVEYPELLKIEVEDMVSPSEQEYQLVAVVSHHGNSITSGHYTAHVLRNGQWYSTNDSTVAQSSKLAARSLEAYILMYEKITSTSTSTQLNKGSKENSTPMPIGIASPMVEEIKVLQSTPPNYYKDPPTSTSPCKPAICRTRKSVQGLKYKSLSDGQIAEAKLKAYQDRRSPINHPRLRGCTSSDLLQLMPGSWLSNLILDKYLTLTEDECRLIHIGNNVRTVNCDVFNTMKSPSMELFKKWGYDKLYGGILTCEVILGAVNFGNHWCLLATFPNSKHMVFLDSLYQGVWAKEAIQRMQNFLECAQKMSPTTQVALDWKDWIFYNMPREDLHQQQNGDDCGVFVAKWAQHIALGLPLDFTQDDMETFRFSIILEMWSDKISLQTILPSPTIVTSAPKSNTTKPAMPEPSNQFNVADNDKPKGKLRLKRKAKPSHEKSITGCANSDDEFQSARKCKSPKPNDLVESRNLKGQNQKVQKEKAMSPEPYSVLHDHCYSCKATSPIKATQSAVKELPENVKVILSPGYKYNVVNYEELEKESFTGAPKEAFKVKFNIGNVTSEAEVKKWVSELALSSNIKYNSQGGYKRKGVKVLFSRWYICQCKRKKLTKKQQDAKTNAIQKRRNGFKTNRSNCEEGDAQFHLLTGLETRKLNVSVKCQ